MKPADLALVGKVVGVSSGRVQVAWADGTRSEAHPEALYVINSEEDHEEDDAGDEYAADDDAEAGGASDSDEWVTDEDSADSPMVMPVALPCWRRAQTTGTRLRHLQWVRQGIHFEIIRSFNLTAGLAQCVFDAWGERLQCL